MVEFRAKFIVPQNPNDQILIDIPFNLWSEFGKKGMFDVDLRINNVSLSRVGLLPRGNGKYSIKFTKQLQKKVKILPYDELYISVTLSDKEIEAKEEKSKEFRKICNISLVKQTNFKNCGQACIAMLTGITIDEICKEMHTNDSTSIGQLLEALDQFGIRHAENNVRLSKKNPNIPDIAILTVHLPTYTHWVLFYKGTYFDPEFGEFVEYNKGKITSFLECFE